MEEMMRGEMENFFSRKKKFSLSPRAPLSFSRKAEYFFLPPVGRQRSVLHAVV
jgi:hypothetical protein